MEESTETFYQDEGIASHFVPSFMYDKNDLHLNLQPEITDPKLGELKRHGTPTGLNSPDMGLLKLGSPELEKMIMALQGNVTTTPTPNTYVCANPPVVAEHEQYARGFTDALQDLHDRQAAAEANSLIDLAENQAVNASTDPFLGHHNTTRTPYRVLTNNIPSMGKRMPHVEQMPPQTFAPNCTDDPYNNSISISKGNAIYSMPSSSNIFAPVIPYHPIDRTPFQGYSENFNDNTGRALTTYPTTLEVHKNELHSAGYQIDPTKAQIVTDPYALAPIDLEMQEVVKRERKKQRNRIASSKCRKRKLEREARLENRVKDLKERNIELNAVANALKQQVCDLKQKVMEHVSEGCQIMLQHQNQIHEQEQ